VKGRWLYSTVVVKQKQNKERLRSADDDLATDPKTVVSGTLVSSPDSQFYLLVGISN
jgi:hypothetical protein